MSVKIFIILVPWRRFLQPEQKLLSCWYKSGWGNNLRPVCCSSKCGLRGRTKCDQIRSFFCRQFGHTQSCSFCSTDPPLVPFLCDLFCQFLNKTSKIKTCYHFPQNFSFIVKQNFKGPSKDVYIHGLQRHDAVGRERRGGHRNDEPRFLGQPEFQLRTRTAR
jgi:hypothetical protein